MKKCIGCLLMLAMLVGMAGCSRMEGQGVHISALYAVAALISLVLLVCYVSFAQRKDGLFVLLFSAVSVVNIGYYALAKSQTLTQALWANRVSYLGSVFLPAIMLLIILKATNIQTSKRLPYLLAFIGAGVFLLAASPGVLQIYYKEVTLVTLSGVSALQKVYGPLHILYGFYLILYFAAMVAMIIYAGVRKKLSSEGHVVILAIAVLVNIGVWLMEQIVRLDFEFLSFSYIIAELFLLGLHLIIRENEQLRAVTQVSSNIPMPQTETGYSTNDMQTSVVAENHECVSETIVTMERHMLDSEPAITQDKFERYKAGIERLTKTEKAIHDAHIQQMSTKQIMAAMNITENTLKFHNKNLYHKLGVSSRKELKIIYSELYAEQSEEQKSGL